MTWTEGRRLESVTQSGQKTTYQYNAAGQRIQKTNPDGSYTRYCILDGRVIGEIIYKKTANGVKWSHGVRYIYGDDGSVVGFGLWGADTKDEWERYYFVKNLQGDVLKVYRVADNALVASYEYDPYGNIRSATGEMAEENPFRYRSYYYDTETGFYYLQSRYYDPQTCRSINADDTSNLAVNGDFVSFNLFAYCLNDPVNRTDVTGEWSLPNWAKVAIGAVATVAAVAVTVATGGAAAPVLIGVASSTLGGAATSAIKHRVTTGSWEGTGKAALDGAATGFMTGGLCALGGSVIGGAVRTIKNARSGITIGKVGQFEDVAKIAKVRHYSGLKEFHLIEKTLGKKAAETVGWWQNKCVVKGVMVLKGAIYDCGGALTGAYAKEVVLTRGYQFLYNVWLM